MSRMLHRPRRPDAPRASARPRAADDDAPLELPAYEPPTYPMDETSKQKLTALYENRATDTARRTYEEQLSVSTTHLFKTIGSINDVIFAKKRTLRNMAQKRRARGDEGAGQEKDEQELSLEEYVAGLDARITALTESLEEAQRWVIDSRAELDDQQPVLESVVAGLNAQQPRPEPGPPKRRKKGPKREAAGSDAEDGDAPADEEGEVEDMEEDADEAEAAEDVPPLIGVKELLHTARKAKQDEYDALSAYEKYARHNDYISFKKNWHDALHHEDQAPLPDATTWFDRHGRPTMGTVADQDDDDLVVEREIIDLKCPLSLQTMKQPYSNHQCKHTFEKMAIMEFIQSSGGVAKCPVCSQHLRIKDLYLDEVILEKARRAAAAAALQQTADTSDIEPDDEAHDASMVVGQSVSIKKEKGRSSRRHLEDIEADDDSDC
ncbi:zinc-finger of the MIZ type in Nse subunit-domain-containing protein [Dichotomopilus funicola]|uniref:peptidylprolyl isomerase n=1 Tax=Dichotomopilus funicola TaxID=1934379 RepID=A0AAN6ZRM2_9PEZI|nr:zinc-finger of the MIZ type in Nse subunit-domain-containing protein [Dichotomopilus funicola]